MTTTNKGDRSMMDDAKALMGGGHGWKSRLARCLGIKPGTVHGWTELPPQARAFVIALSYVSPADREHVIDRLVSR